MAPSADFDVPAVLRAARRLVRLSQRELAERAQVPLTTLARLESGATRNPSLLTLQRLLAAATCRLLVVTEAGVPLFAHPDESSRDDAGRHYPAHLDLRPTPGPYDFLNEEGWWGWSRTRFWRPDARIPFLTFIRLRNGYYNRALDPRTGEAAEPPRPDH